MLGTALDSSLCTAYFVIGLVAPQLVAVPVRPLTEVAEYFSEVGK